jgi:prepilin-type N-terminal cleavage/methylation domain-containing protein/prepilin-type processing-associated H-X9-DG protein
MFRSTRVVGTCRDSTGRKRRSRQQHCIGARWAFCCAGQGFTLIEMLVVLAVIIILISLLLPGLRGARDAGRTAVCLSNQKQISAAVANYANASKDTIPREGTDVVEANGDETRRRYRICWPVALRPFLDDRVTIDQDPNDLFANAPYYSDPARPKDNHKIHYVVNSMPMVVRGVVDVTARDHYWYRRGPQQMARMQTPAATVYMTEFSDDANLSVWNQMMNLSQEDLVWSQPYDIWDILHIQSGSSQYRICATRHSGSGNATFMDGHALTMKRADLENIDLWDDKDYGVRSEAPNWAQ